MTGSSTERINQLQSEDPQRGKRRVTDLGRGESGLGSESSALIVSERRRQRAEETYVNDFARVKTRVQKIEERAHKPRERPQRGQDWNKVSETVRRE